MNNIIRNSQSQNIWYRLKISLPLLISVIVFVFLFERRLFRIDYYLLSILISSTWSFSAIFYLSLNRFENDSFQALTMILIFGGLIGGLNPYIKTNFPTNIYSLAILIGYIALLVLYFRRFLSKKDKNLLSCSKLVLISSYCLIGIMEISSNLFDYELILGFIPYYLSFHIIIPLAFTLAVVDIISKRES